MWGWILFSCFSDSFWFFVDFITELGCTSRTACLLDDVTSHAFSRVSTALVKPL